MISREPVLLNDEQVRRYITDGYVKIDCEVAAEIHATIARKLTEMIDEGPNLGNNVLPRVPEFRHILNCPEVRGALLSLLGPGYIEHPHRYCHDRRPSVEVPEDIPEQVARQAHQDSYTPMSSPRQHYGRLARIIYYPQDTPIELGPTHVTPGTSYNKVVTDEDRRTGLPMDGPAGSLWITHFDVVHAAGVNLSDQVRHMIKFIYVQRSGRAAPAWDCRDRQWKNPEALDCPWDLEVVWSHMWDWMCGKRDRYESWRRAGAGSAAANGDLSHLIEALSDSDRAQILGVIRQLAVLGPAAAAAVPSLANLLNADPQPVRTAATYALGAIGAPAVDHLIARLREADRGGWEKEGQVGWDEGSVHMPDEAHALAAIGEPAVGPLLQLLEVAGEWGRIASAFALGEMDAGAAATAPALARLLDDDSHRVVRTALDSLGIVGGEAVEAVPRIARFLVERRDDWEEILTGKRAWCAQDRVRINAAIALMRLETNAVVAEEALVEALDDPTGYVSLYAGDALLRMDSPTAARAAMEMAMAQRWDASLSADRPW